MDNKVALSKMNEKSIDMTPILGQTTLVAGRVDQ
jgi:hypothetical protein